MSDEQRVDLVIDRNRAHMHSLEVGQCKVIWSKKHPWVEEGKGLKHLAAPLSGSALQPRCATITVLLWSASSWLNPSALLAWARQGPFRKQKDYLIYKFRGQEVRADLLPHTGQRIASTYSANSPCNLSLAQVYFPEKSPHWLEDLKKEICYHPG